MIQLIRGIIDGRIDSVGPIAGDDVDSIVQEILESLQDSIGRTQEKLLLDLQRERDRANALERKVDALISELAKVRNES